ncbi:hypothetical protein ABL78_6589 [Leptomonas seymouri]|uniref:Uncharacterized protein n=1 Tax=Leptomonas seymouri TaxID=5684 RepID=A0A0N1I1T5_LEPSE|nr:hypothetical protein ABL78_6589 [Leptomonas seymouri]|eukprot:KPI84360.1 hypothetical protein ABL78_6589 [Leptomonas seymouri]
MPGRSSSGEDSFQFSNSSSFSSVSDTSEESVHVAHCLQPLTGTGEIEINESIRLPVRRAACVGVVSSNRTGESDIEESETTSSPSITAPSAELTHAHTPSSNDSAGDDARELLRSSAPGDSNCRFFAKWDSSPPPAASSYFCVEGDAAADEPLQLSLMWEEESLGHTSAQRRMANLAGLPARSSPRSDSPSSFPPARSCTSADASVLSLPLETVVVNAAHAREAHEHLVTFSAETIAQYQLMKFKAVQRVYRTYYDKWRAWMTRHGPLATPQKASKEVQTPSVRLRSISIGTDFVDLDSFHFSRSVSGQGTPQAHCAQERTPSPDRQMRYSSLRDFSPPPRMADGMPLGSTEWSPFSKDRLPLTFSAAHTPPSDTHPTREWPSPLAPLPINGIGVRTNPSKLVDFGRHSVAPPRKSVRVLNPVVEEPKVVPSPKRIFRL